MARSEIPARLAAWLPRWWDGQGGAGGSALNALLWPAEMAYRGALAARNAAYDRGLASATAAPLPVISVGNLSVGGAGKTPVAAWLADLLRTHGERPAILLRGYGRDEVLVHSELNPEVPVFAAAARALAAARAAEAGCSVAILDDGFQHRSLARDLDILLISADGWSGSRHLLPRGPWREHLRAARRADLVLVTRKAAAPEDAARVREAVQRLVEGLPVLECAILPADLQPLHGTVRSPLETLSGERVLAVAALALPGAFATNLRAAGAEIELAAFPDHHDFTRADADAILLRAKGRTVVMTMKDAVKLRSLLDDDVAAVVLRQRVELPSGAEPLHEALRSVLGWGRA